MLVLFIGFRGKGAGWCGAKKAPVIRGGVLVVDVVVDVVFKSNL